jgi:hypothetical protein
VEDMTLFQAAGSAAATYIMNAVSVKGGSLNMALSIACDDEEKTIGNRLKTRLLDALRKV